MTIMRGLFGEGVVCEKEMGGAKNVAPNEIRTNKNRPYNISAVAY
jgi:hypothetical protein